MRLFGYWFHSKTISQVALDTVLLFFSTILAMVWFSRDKGLLLGGSAIFSAVLLTLAAITLIIVLGSYHAEGLGQGLKSMGRGAVLFITPVTYIALMGLPEGGAHYETLDLGAVLAFGSVVLSRVLPAYGGSGQALGKRIIVLGTGGEAREVETALMRFGSDVQVVGFYPLRIDASLQVPPSRVLTSPDGLAALAQKLMVDEIIVAVSEQRGPNFPLDELLNCRLAGVRVLDLATYFERDLGQVRLESLRASWLIFGEGFRQGRVRTFVKRIFDISVAIVLLILAIPVILLTAILIVIESGPVIFYRQERVGKDGRTFHVIKLRSMRVDAERDGKPRWAQSNDNRVTRVGRIIRKTRIDELPQLFNVLRGEMSLVGPRPERPYFVEQLAKQIPYYAARHSIKPGLTGWAQVRYHYGSSTDDARIKLQYDLYYVKNHSLLLDLFVLLETIRVVLTGAGGQ